MPESAPAPELHIRTFKYTGPVQSIALQAKGADGEMAVFLEETLHPGKSYPLPDGHPIVEGLKALKLLTVEG